MAIGDRFPIVMGSEKAIAGGVATLDEDGKLLEEQLPDKAMQSGNNSNILINAYFRKPVNLLGKNSYSGGNIITVSNWRSRGVSTVVSIEDNGLKVSSAESLGGIGQLSENFDNLLGQTVTFSILLDDVHIESGTMRLALFFTDSTIGTTAFATEGSAQNHITNPQPGLYSFTGKIVSETAMKYLNAAIHFINITAESYCIVRAIKLELGSQQTLAHQDADGNWVLNDPVDYESEYAKCAQYDPQTGKWIGYEKPVQDMAQLALQSVCPSNKILYDNVGKPGVYVQRIPRRLNELLTNGDDSVHPAFLVNNSQIDKLMIGKFQGKADGNRIYSLPGEDPTTGIALDSYETYCKGKGDGHHCITAAEWAFLALCAKKDGTMPKGNNNYGKDTSETSYVAIPAHSVQDGGKTARTLTGTGPLTWSDTGDLTGIFDLNGNILEWTVGIRLVKGELQVIPYNDAASPDCNTAADSNRWKAINAAATGYADLFVTPNGQGTTTGTVKLDYVSSHWQWAVTITSQADSSRSAAFAVTTYASDLSAFCKMFLQAMALGPEEEAKADDYAGDYLWADNGADERCAIRGGSWNYGGAAGVFSLYFSGPRSYVGWHLGGRPAFIDMPSSTATQNIEKTTSSEDELQSKIAALRASITS